MVSVPPSALALMVVPSIAWAAASVKVSYWLTALVLVGVFPISWALAELAAYPSDHRPPKASVNVWALTIFAASAVFVLPGTAISIWFLRETRPIWRVGPWRKVTGHDDSPIADDYASKR